VAITFGIGKNMKETKATLYKIDGSKESLILTPKTRLETLQKLVGGYIEVIHINGNDLVINEEGSLLNLHVNPWSYLVGKNSVWENVCFHGDLIMIEGRLP
jgi:hypothetical protein